MAPFCVGRQNPSDPFDTVITHRTLQPSRSAAGAGWNAFKEGDADGEACKAACGLRQVQERTQVLQEPCGSAPSDMLASELCSNEIRLEVQGAMWECPFFQRLPAQSGEGAPAGALPASCASKACCPACSQDWVPAAPSTGPATTASMQAVCLQGRADVSGHRRLTACGPSRHECFSCKGSRGEGQEAAEGAAARTARHRRLGRPWGGAVGTGAGGDHVMCVSPYPHVRQPTTNPCLYWIGSYAEGDQQFDLAAAQGGAQAPCPRVFEQRSLEKPWC